jgi:hypothetical protein
LLPTKTILTSLHAPVLSKGSKHVPYAIEFGTVDAAILLVQLVPIVVAVSCCTATADCSSLHLTLCATPNVLQRCGSNSSGISSSYL